MSRLAVFPGSFDPLHNGHLDLIDRGRALFDEVVVAVLTNTGKTPLFSVEERLEMIREVLAGRDRCRAVAFSGLLVQFMAEAGAGVCLRGIRGASDIDHEFQMAHMNRSMSPDAETVFLATGAGLGHLSSSLIKEIYRLGGEVGKMVPGPVADRLARLSR